MTSVAMRREHLVRWSSAEEPFTGVVMHSWRPEIEPAHPLECTRVERDVLQRFSSRSCVFVRYDDQGLGI